MSGFSGRLGIGPRLNQGDSAMMPGSATEGRTVIDFLQRPSPTLLPLNYAGPQALPYPDYMVAGSPYPHSAQTKLAIWNRASSSKTPMPSGVTYNSPRNRMTQT